MIKRELVVSFSGGRTSAFMSALLKRNWHDEFDFTFIFANTGCENEATLQFVQDCDEAFDLRVVWVEAVVNPTHGEGITHRETSLADAYRPKDYKDPLHPYHAFIRKSGIPNANKPQCSDRLKTLPIEHYKKEQGLQGELHAIGMRMDESDRVMSPGMRDRLITCGLNPDAWRTSSHADRMRDAKTYDKHQKTLERYSRELKGFGLVYPLHDWYPSDLQDVEDFWADQDFKLELEEHNGNCQTCWKKSAKKLSLIALENPQFYDAFAWWESMYHDVKPNKDGLRRVFFRGHTPTVNIIDEAQNFTIPYLRSMIGSRSDESTGCTESCEAYSLSVGQL